MKTNNIDPSKVDPENPAEDNTTPMDEKKYKKWNEETDAARLDKPVPYDLDAGDINV